MEDGNCRARGLREGRAGAMNPVVLRPYQDADIRAVRVLLRKHRSVVYVLPTGGGKTVWAGAWAQIRAAERAQCPLPGSPQGNPRPVR